MSSLVYCICEGHTEQLFVRDVLAPYMATKNIFIQAPLLGKPGHKGGDIRFDRAKNDISNFLKQPQSPLITTMFDYFRISPKWPGIESLKQDIFQGRSLSAHEKGRCIEQATSIQLQKEFPEARVQERFIPYIEMHEFEALLFTSPSVIADVCQLNSSAQLEAIVQEFPTPEDINNDPEKSPSKRLESLIPNYRKKVLGKVISEKIGIEAIRSACPHFNDWLLRLEHSTKRENQI